MSDLASALNSLKDSLCRQIDVGGLFTRNPTAHKWKAPWRALLLRESIAWRLHDLLDQSLLLSRQNHLLGARILLRSAFETLAVLIYLNRSVRAVIAGTLDFHEFSEKTSKLLLGSRNKTTNYEQVSILTVLKSADKCYSGLYELYEALSESAHPNCDGMLLGYSTSDRNSYVTNFENKWLERYGQSHEDGVMACLSIFTDEYDKESVNALEAFEDWIELNDSQLEATRPIPK
jgi:hypothetical protein